jgi:hypothetical protein
LGLTLNREMSGDGGIDGDRRMVSTWKASEDSDGKSSYLHNNSTKMHRCSHIPSDITACVVGLTKKDHRRVIESIRSMKLHLMRELGWETNSPTLQKH